LAAGLSLDAYSQEEEAKVAALIKALDAASNEAEVNAVIAAHAAAIEAEAAAIDVQVDTRGDQVFLEQRRMEQRITVDVKQELQRAAKAVSVTCD
jgi:ribonuclease HI